MRYGRISTPKKGVTLVTSLLIHFLILVLVAFSVPNPPQKNAKEFELNAIRFINMPSMAKDKKNTKGDNKKTDKLVRKKKTHKTFPQKGKRRALAPKTKLESLKKAASKSVNKPQDTSLPKFTPAQPKNNTFNKPTQIAKAVKRELELKQKIVSVKPKRIAKLDTHTSIKKYKGTLKSFNKKQIKFADSRHTKFSKGNKTQLLQKLNRSQNNKAFKQDSNFKLKLNKTTKFIPQGEKTQATKLTASQSRQILKKQLDYQPRRQTSKALTNKQHKISYSKQSNKLFKKNKITHNRPITQATDRLREPKENVQIDRMSKKTTYTAKVENSSLIKSGFALEYVRKKEVEKQNKTSNLSNNTHDKKYFKRKLSYQQNKSKHNNAKVKSIRPSISYRAESKIAAREISETSNLDVVNPVKEQQVKSYQKFETMNRQKTLLNAENRTNKNLLSSNNLLENLNERTFSSKQVRMAKLETASFQFTAKNSIKLEQTASSAIYRKISQGRVSYQKTSQQASIKTMRQTNGLAEAAMPQETANQTNQTQLGTINKQTHKVSVSDNVDSAILDSVDYTAKSAPTLDYDKSRRNESMSSLTGAKSQSLAFAYDNQKINKSSKLDITSSTRTLGSNSLHGSPTSPLLSSQGQSVSGEKNATVIDIDLPSGNTTSDTLYRLTGEIGGDVKKAFVTINDITQLVEVVNGSFEVEIAMVKGINEISVFAFNARGSVGKREVKIFYNPPPGVPMVRLDTPENGKQGVKEGDPIIVSGNIDDTSIAQATLYLNGIPIKIRVENGRFEKKVFMPNSRITTFRIMAQTKNSPPGYSSMHTILSGYDIDILNPRPY